MKKKKQNQNSNPQQPKEQKNEVVVDSNLLTFGGHLEVLRQMLFRILAVAGSIAAVVFCFKDITWQILLAPSEWNFCTYRWLETIMQAIGIDFLFNEFHVRLLGNFVNNCYTRICAIYSKLKGTKKCIRAKW